HRGRHGELSEVAARNGLSALPYFALAAGFLTGKYRLPRRRRGPHGTSDRREARGARAQRQLRPARSPVLPGEPGRGGAQPEHVGRVQTSVPFAEGATLVLYTDGLIERRTEDIDRGLARLAGSLAHHRHAEPEALADALLADLLPAEGNTDDTALIVLRL
ncbi:SpoIIE family protein phosphatase, partial [Streptomyces sp. Agncl-13]|uniref:SpoIIE family protein phosphatase n=1 Tax=Streptomyces sp. Agncl-13 TaxID=3400628 RepID=UPI003A86BB8F